jgi:hypothetical protein
MPFTVHQRRVLTEHSLLRLPTSKGATRSFAVATRAQRVRQRRRGSVGQVVIQWPLLVRQAAG